jgi:hypothetical protein
MNRARARPAVSVPPRPTSADTFGASRPSTDVGPRIHADVRTSAPPRHRTFVRGSYPLRRRSQQSFVPNPRQRRIRFRTLFTVARYTVNPEGQSAQGQSWAELAIEAVKLSGYTLHQFLPGPRYAPDLRFTINNRHSCFWACLARQPPKEPCHLTPLAASLFDTLAQQSARNRRECISKPSYRVRGG